MGKLVRLLCVVVVGLALVLAGGMGGLYWASQRVPDFYQQALETDPEEARQGSDELLTAATSLVSQARRDSQWEAIFTEQQINGWLAVDLVENHPDALPPEFSDPRVSIEPGHMLVACRYEGSVPSVLSLDVDVYLTESNLVSLRIRKARAGSVPLPLERILKAVEEAAHGMDLHIRWKQIDGDPVALIEIPPIEGEDGQPLIVDSLQLNPGEIYISGKTGTPSTGGKNPHHWELPVASRPSAEKEKRQR